MLASSSWNETIKNDLFIWEAETRAFLFHWCWLLELYLSIAVCLPFKIVMEWREKTWLLFWREWSNILLKEIRQIIYQFPLLFSDALLRSMELSGMMIIMLMAQLNMNRNGRVAKWLKKTSADCTKAPNVTVALNNRHKKEKRKFILLAIFIEILTASLSSSTKEEKWEKSVDCWFTSIGHVVVNSSSRGPGKSRKKIALCRWPPPRKQFRQAEKTNV